MRSRLVAAFVVLLALFWASPASAQVECVNVSDGTRICRGPGSPNSAVLGNVGDLFLRADGAAGTSVYIKETGAGTDTGWTAVSVATVSGTTGTLAKFTSATSLGNSICAESGTTITCVDTMRLRLDATYFADLYVNADGLNIDTSTGVSWSDPTITLGEWMIGEHLAESQTFIMAWGDSDAARTLAANRRFWLDRDGNQRLFGNVQTDHHVSGATGWACLYNGNCDMQYLQVRELHATVFTADITRALNGSEIIAKSVTTLAQAFTCPAQTGSVGTRSTDLWVKDFPSMPNAQAFEPDDWVVVFVNARDPNPDGSQSLTTGFCAGQVIGYFNGDDDTQRWTFVRGVDDDGGSVTAGTVTPVDGTVIDFGVSGNGFLLCTAIDGQAGVNSPYCQVVTWVDSPVPTNWTLQTRWGNQIGVTGTLEYGLFAGSSYGSDEDARYLLATNLRFETANLDLKMKAGAATVIHLNPNAGDPSIAIGNPIPTAVGAGRGAFLGCVGATCQFRIGDAPGSGDYFLWDGDSIKLVSQTLLIDDAGISLAIDANTTWSAPNAFRFYGLSSVSDIAGMTASDSASVQRVRIESSRLTGSGQLYFVADNLTDVGNEAIFTMTGASGPGNSSASLLASTIALQGATSVVTTFNVGTLSSVTPSAVTTASNGNGTPAAATLSALSSIVHYTCNDPDGCVATLSEAAIPNGTQFTVLVAVGSVTVTDSAGVVELDGGTTWTGTVYGSLTLTYMTDRWVEVARRQP